MESPDSCATPAWIEANSRAELIITGGDVVSGHDRETGRGIWRADVLNPDRDRNYRIVASPTIVGGLIIAPTRNNPLVAMRPGGSGDVASTHGVEVCTGAGRADAGERRQAALRRARRRRRICARREDQPNGVWSAAFAARHLQRVADSGRRQNLRHHRGGRDYHGLPGGPKFEILSSNSLLGDCAPYCLSTVAISDGQIFIRVVLPVGDWRAEEGRVDNAYFRSSATRCSSVSAPLPHRCGRRSPR